MTITFIFFALNKQELDSRLILSLRSPGIFVACPPKALQETRLSSSWKELTMHAGNVTQKNRHNSSSEIYIQLWDCNHPKRILLHSRAERIPVPRWDNVVIIHWYLDTLSGISPHGNTLGHMLNTSLCLSSQVSGSDLKPVLQDCYWIGQFSFVLRDFCAALRS